MQKKKTESQYIKIRCSLGVNYVCTFHCGPENEGGSWWIIYLPEGERENALSINNKHTPNQTLPFHLRSVFFYCPWSS